MCGPLRIPGGSSLRSELSYQHASRREPVPVALLVELLLHNAVGADEKLDRVRNAEEPVVFGDILVQNAELADDRGFGVGKQGESDVHPLREMLERVRRVKADCGNPDPAALEVLPLALQLHELALAEWSPVCRAEEEEQEPVLARQILE